MMSPLLSAMQPGSVGHTSDIMEAACRFVGALGKSIMKGAAPMLDSLIKANMEVITTSRAVKFKSGDKNVHQVEVTFQSIFSKFLIHFPSFLRRLLPPAKGMLRRKDTWTTFLNMKYSSF